MKYAFQHLGKIPNYLIAGVLGFAALINAFNAVSSFSLGSTLMVISGLVLVWIALKIYVHFRRPYIHENTRLVKIGIYFYCIFYGIFLCLFLHLGNLVYSHYFPKPWDPFAKEVVFSGKDSVMTVSVLPFKADGNNKDYDADYVGKIKECLQDMKDSGHFTYKVNFPPVDSADIPTSDSTALVLGERSNCNMVIYGSYEENGNGVFKLRVRWILTKSYQGRPFPSRRKGDTDMQDISTLDQLRKGDMLADVKYILYWTEGLSAYQKYNYDRAITYFEKALAIDKEGTCDASNHTLLANLYHELGRDSIALIHCEKALKSQRLAGDSTSPFYAYLMICYGAVKNSLVKKDKEAFQSIRSGIAMLENFPRKDSMNMGIGYTELGKYYEEGYDPDSALMEYSKALSYLNKKDPSHISAIMVLHNNIGIVHINKRNFREGITELHIALQFQNRLGRPDLNMSSYILAGLGSAYAQIGGRNDSAEIFYHQADSILSTFMSNATRRASLMTNNGNLFLGLGNYPLARQYHQKAVELLKNTPDTLTGLYADALINLGESLKKTGDPGNATKLELEAETIYIKIRRKDPSSLAVLYIDLADDFCEQDTVAAGKYLTKTLQLLSQAPADPLWSYYYWIKARLAIKKGDLPGARRETESAFNIFSKSGDWNTDTNVDCIEFKKFRNDLLNRRG